VTLAAGSAPARDSVLLGKYRVEDTLGFGGMGVVIQAHNLAIDERVAIKLMRDDVMRDPASVERFVPGAKAAVRLKSEHVAKIRDVGTLEDGRPYMVMELLEGVDLGKLLADHGAVDPARGVDLLLQACDAIAEAHALGIVHRDIKPTNLMITRRRDDSELLKVLDFGISKAQSGAEMSLTQTSSMLGTPAYMSPEQMRSARTVDPRSDIWALGTVLYELVEGRHPFVAESFAELCVLVALEAPAPMSTAPHLAPIMERCLAKSLDERFQNVGELAAALAPFASDPERARRQVQRIQRVLGLRVGSRDSTPLTMRREDLRDVQRPPPRRFPQAPGPPAGGGGCWKSFRLLVVLFGVGIAAGLYVTSGRATSSGAPAAATPADATPADAGAAVDAPSPVDAAVPVDAAPPTDASVLGDAGKESAKPPPTRPKPATRPRRPREPRHSPPLPPHPPGTGSGTGSAAPSTGCDPFKHSKRC